MRDERVEIELRENNGTADSRTHSGAPVALRQIVAMQGHFWVTQQPIEEGWLDPQSLIILVRAPVGHSRQTDSSSSSSSSSRRRRRRR